MYRVKLLALLAAILCSSPAWAFFQENQTSTRVANASSVTIPIPASITNGDLLVTFITAEQSGNSATTNMNAPSGGTGSWTFDSTLNGAVSWYGNGGTLGNGKVGVVTHIYHTGDTAPTVGNGQSTTFWTATTTAYWGASGVDVSAAGTPNSSGTAVTFPTITPTGSNEEIIYFATTFTGSLTIANFPHITSCSSQTDDLDYETNEATTPQVFYYDVNEGPCTLSGGVTAPTFTLSASSSNLGVALAITPIALAPITHSPITTTAGKLLQNLQGSFYYSSVNSNPNQAPSVLFNSWIDGIALYTSWNQNETNACDEYSFDLLDNWILNARTLGLKVKMSFTAGEMTPCGGTSEIACSASFPPTIGGPNDAGGSAAPPTWILASNACTNSHAMVSGTDYISTYWTQGFGAPKANTMLLFDPDDVFYQHALDRFQTAVNTRYSGISNIIAMQVTGMNAGTAETFLNNGANNSTIACSSSVANCASISGLAAWAATHAYALNAKIFPTTNNAALDYFKATVSGTSGSSQPNWGSVCSTTCTDGSVTWTNEGQWTNTITDGTQWLAMPLTTHCTGSGAPYAGCTGVGTGSGLGSYSATGVSTCGGGSATQPFIKCDEEPGFQHFFAEDATLWPHNVMRFSAAGNASPPGSFSSPNTDTFTSDETGWVNTNYPNEGGVESHGLGWSASGNVFFNAAQGNGYLNPAGGDQPTISIGYQEVGQQSNVVGGICAPPNWTASDSSYTSASLIVPHTNNPASNQYLETAASCTSGTSGAQPNWGSSCNTFNSTCTDNTCTWKNKGPMWQGLSSTDCVAPETYSILSTSMFPYNEWYPATLNAAADTPWVKLLHDFVWNR